MKVFIASSYSSKVDYATGKVFDDYREWLENILTTLEAAGFEVVSALREDNYRINDRDPAAAIQLDMQAIHDADMLLARSKMAFLRACKLKLAMHWRCTSTYCWCTSWGQKLAYINDAMVKASMAHKLTLPLDTTVLRSLLVG